jgi:hypothetical protein
MRTIVVTAIALLAGATLSFAAGSPRAPERQPEARATNTAPAPRTMEMGGFVIDRHRVSAADWPALERKLQRQIEIVASVGLPDDVLAFFRRIPIEIDPAQNGNGGTYQQRKVILPDEPIPENRPVLLHELLHAYHYEVLGNVEPIRQAHRQALQSEKLGGRHRGAHFLANHAEYFAVVASIYLFGVIQQPPFNCRTLAAEQPEFLAYLARLFGPHPCG